MYLYSIIYSLFFTYEHNFVLREKHQLNTKKRLMRVKTKVSEIYWNSVWRTRLDSALWCVILRETNFIRTEQNPATHYSPFTTFLPWQYNIFCNLLCINLSCVLNSSLLPTSVCLSWFPSILLSAKNILKHVAIRLFFIL